MTLHTLVFTRITSVVKPVHIFMGRNRVLRLSSVSIVMYILHIYIWGDTHDVHFEGGMGLGVGGKAKMRCYQT